MKHLQNILSRALCVTAAALCTVMSAPPAVSAESDWGSSIGLHAEWSLTDGTLVISGAGRTYHYDEVGIYLMPEDERPFGEQKEEIRAVIVEDGITQLGQYLFAALPNLETVTVADSVKVVSAYCFADCPNLKSVTLPAGAELASHLFDGDEKLFPDTDFQILNGNVLYRYTGAEKTVTVPDGIEIISSNCFDGNTDTEQIILPEGLRTVSGGAFIGCANLTQINLPDSLERLDGAAFSGCAALTEISIPPAVRELHDATFQGCTSLKKVAFRGNAVQSIGGFCFMSCTALQEITLPDSVTALRQMTFSGCTALQTVCGLGNVKQILDSAFRGCAELTSLDISPALEYAASGAFSECDRLLAAHTAEGAFCIGGVLIQYLAGNPVYHIPEGTVTVLNDAFANSKIVAVYCPASLENIRENAFSGCKLLTDLWGTPGSDTERFAAENDVNFRDITAAPPAGDDMTLDPAHEIWSFGNSAEVFGGDYALTDADRERLTALGVSTDTEKSWGGSCVGLSVTVILAKNGLLTPSILQTGAETLSQVEPREEIVSLINYYQCMQGGSARADALETDFVKFYRMLQIAENIKYGESPFLLTFATKTGSHAVVGYGKESGTWVIDGKTYDGRILVWDSNFPQGLHADSCLYFDSETFDYCIPYYGVHVSDGASDNTAGIITVRNDLAALNENPHPLVKSSVQPGDFDGNGIVNIADAVLLARFNAEDSGLEPAMLHTDVVDLNADGTVDALDLAQLLRSLANLKD